MEHQSFIRIMQHEYGIDIAYSSQVLVPVYPTREEAELLKVSGKKPLLSIKSLTHDRSDRIVKFSDLHANTDVMDYTFSWIVKDEKSE